MAVFSISAFAQSYDSLWKQETEAAQKDLPKTQMEVLRKIVAKAEQEKAYGQLLAAELKYAGLQTAVSPDSFEVEVERLEAQAADASANPVLAAIYYTALGKIYSQNNDLGRNHEQVGKAYFSKALSHPEQLAAQHYTSYRPLVDGDDDSDAFNNDLLHVIGLEAGESLPLSIGDYYSLLIDFYNKEGNRRAACLLSLKLLREQQLTTIVNNKKYMAKLDSLLELYHDLPEACEIAIDRVCCLRDNEEECYHYAQAAAERWSSWKRVDALKNEMAKLTTPMFSSGSFNTSFLPYRQQTLMISRVRNINQLTMKVWRLNASGETSLELHGDKNLGKVKALITGNPVQMTNRTYTGLQPYQSTCDSILVNGLSPGVYLMELSADNDAVKPQYTIVYVSGVTVIWEEQPKNTIRYAVVSATTGQPLPHAHLKLCFGYRDSKDYKETTLTTDKCGEVLYAYGKHKPDELYPYTDNDRACQKDDAWSHYNYGKRNDSQSHINVYTDRSIYRPGQTVHVAAIAYRRYEVTQHQVCANNELTITLIDANYQQVAEKKVITDSYGTAATDFTLPTTVLTGAFTIRVRGDVMTAARIQVEEYKRPTFEVTFSDYEEAYAPGDTIRVRGYAKSYAGVPVQGAKVKYTIKRRHAWWCWWNPYASEPETLLEGETTTDDDGTFYADMPMVLPKGIGALKGWDNGALSIARRGLFFNIIADAQVTDVAGENHNGQFSLPLSTKPTTLLCDLPEKALSDSLHAVTFTYQNAAGKEIDGSVRFSINGKPFNGGRAYGANTAIVLPQLASGKHTFEAVCGTDTLTQEVIVFSMSDTRPVVDTHDWFYISSKSFARDEKPVYVQFGSSDENQHVVYGIFAADKVIESGVVDQSNALTTRTFIYNKEYEDGLTLTFAWVHDGRLYQHQEHIAAPLPDNHLKLEWRTFRDRLTPGQQEEWTLTIRQPSGKVADAQLLATLYDKSLDQILKHDFNLETSIPLSQPYVSWLGLNGGSSLLSYSVQPNTVFLPKLSYAQFGSRYFDNLTGSRIIGFGYGRPVKVRGRSAYHSVALASVDGVVANDMAVPEKMMAKVAPQADNGIEVSETSDHSDYSDHASPSFRENFNETAFFYPQLFTTTDGSVTIKFTLPESITTWRFLGVAHDRAMNCGSITGETVAQKTVMIQPNMPRFIRVGDRATVAAKLMNTSDKEVSGWARIELVDPETNTIVYIEEYPYTICANGTSSINFKVPSTPPATGQEGSPQPSVWIVRTTAIGDGYSDGEQHYLPVLPNCEYVTNALPFTQHGSEIKTIDLRNMFPENTTQQRLTIEYTNHPAWLMVQALPFVGDVNEKNAISLSAAYYANSLGRNFLKSMPTLRQTIELWRQEKGEETSMMSNLEKDQNLKELMLKETPWVLEAKNETEQRQSLVQFFDENSMNQRLQKTVDRLQKLQNSDGSWSWWEGMQGSLYMTVAVSKTLVRLNTMIGAQSETADMLTKAFKFMRKEIAKEVVELKKKERSGYKNLRPSEVAVSYLYLCALDGRALPVAARTDNAYLVSLLAKKTTELTIYGKATSAMILAKNGYSKKAAEYLQSIREYTVFTEEMGRYFDTRRAYYSWFDYRIPTEVAVIEALQTITPDDRQTIEEMQRWLLQEKRTQAWDTPVNAVNAIYAFFGNPSNGSVSDQLKNLCNKNTLATMALDGEAIETPKATAGIGYVRASMDRQGSSTLVIEKTDTDTSWGAVHAQFLQPVAEITDAASGIKVVREIIPSISQSPLTNPHSLEVGSRVTVRITIQADRDYDFVQVVDKRAACMEPVQHLSGYQRGCYVSTKDCVTNYYFDMMPKGKHEIETEYYIDREGTYQTGTCTVQCAYAPEYYGRARSEEYGVTTPFSK